MLSDSPVFRHRLRYLCQQSCGQWHELQGCVPYRLHGQLRHMHPRIVGHRSVMHREPVLSDTARDSQQPWNVHCQHHQR